MPLHPNTYYLDGIRHHRPEVIRGVFSEFLPMVAAFIRQNSGTDEDARDIFMDALEAIYRKLRDGELELTASFSTYLFEICKRLWYKRFRRKKFESGVTTDDEVVLNKVQEMDQALEETERMKLMREKFAQLQEDCRQLMSLSWHTDKNMEEVAEALGFSYGYARKRKHICQERLIALVKADPRYRELRTDGRERGRE
ncbi:MAG: sigma-70 family RNA polymerase sigma factor [Saprospiraceae bacterium]|jgi:RNA polymerase sigma factor (sigma-70 family)|nr:sigma-70 family RNA polymerase sigma factor [Saprospiraceae bacterium]